MEMYIPVCAIILIVGLLILFVRQSIIDRVVYKNNIIISFFFIFTTILSLILMKNVFSYEEYASIYQIYYLFIFFAITFVFLLTTLQMTRKRNINKELINSLETDKLFILLDKKERIKDISSSLVKVIGVNKEDVIGKSFFEVANEYFELVSINGIIVNLQTAKEFFKNSAALVKINTKTKKELVIVNQEEQTIILNFSDIPIFNSSKYCGHVLIGDSKNEDSLLTAEKELVDRNIELENIKTRFITHLDITNQSIFFYNIDGGYIWGNDNFVNTLKVDSNTLIKDSFYSFIHPDDLAYYHSIINNLTKESDSYEVKYRFKTSTNYEYVREVGKRTFAKVDEIVGYIEIINSNHYERSNISILDNIKSIEELNIDCKSLYEEKRTFELVTMKLDSIPQINKEHSRGVGNMVIGEYIKVIKKNFVDEDYIYRISGLEFSFIITDYRKMDLIKKALGGNNITSTHMQYGSIKLSLNTYFGLTFSTETANYPDLIKLNYKALNMSLLPQVNSMYFYSQGLLDV